MQLVSIRGVVEQYRAMSFDKVDSIRCETVSFSLLIDRVLQKDSLLAARYIL